MQLVGCWAIGIVQGGAAALACLSAPLCLGAGVLPTLTLTLTLTLTVTLTGYQRSDPGRYRGGDKGSGNHLPEHQLPPCEPQF